MLDLATIFSRFQTVRSATNFQQPTRSIPVSTKIGQPLFYNSHRIATRIGVVKRKRQVEEVKVVGKHPAVAKDAAFVWQ